MRNAPKELLLVDSGPVKNDGPDVGVHRENSQRKCRIGRIRVGEQQPGRY